MMIFVFAGDVDDVVVGVGCVVVRCCYCCFRVVVIVVGCVVADSGGDDC